VKDEFFPLEQTVIAGEQIEGVYLPNWQDQLDRIERKLDALIKALAEDEDQPATESLDGEQVPKPRQESRSL
jgi:hypothetical protein